MSRVRLHTDYAIKVTNFSDKMCKNMTLPGNTH